MMHNSSLFDPMRAFCNAGKCRTTPRILSICVTRDEAVRAEQASRVSFEASCPSLEKATKRKCVSHSTHSADELVKVYFTEMLQSIFDLRKSILASD
jgi:hypothetical protein